MNRLAPVLLLTIFLLSACGQSGNKEKAADQSRNGNPVTTRYKPEKNGKIIARVNGVPIYEDELRGRTVESLVTDEILYQEGLKEGIDKKYQDKVMAYQMSLVVQDMKNGILGSKPPAKEVSDKELLDYYNENKNRLYTNIRVEEINFSDKNLGEKILKMAEEGQKFPDIANSLSKTGAKISATDVGFNKSFSRFFKENKVGTLSEVFDKKDGTYSILRITQVETMPFEKVKGILKYTVEARNKGAEFDNYAQKIAKENGMKIEIIKGSGQQ